MTKPIRGRGFTLHQGDSLSVLQSLDAKTVDCIVTSPPYFGLRDYGIAGQLGAESSPTEYVENLRAVFAEARRVLVSDGTLWLNLGDTYSGYHGNKRVPDDQAPSNKPGYWENMRQSLPGGIPNKNLIGAPWRVALALQDDGWILRKDIIWDKPNCTPERVTDRPTTTHEYVFLFSKSARYYYDADSLRETAGGRNARSVWSVPLQPFKGAHFATMPPELARRCVIAGCKPGGTVLDPFHGSGTTGMVTLQNSRRYIGIDLKQDYLDLSLATRLAAHQ